MKGVYLFIFNVNIFDISAFWCTVFFHRHFNFHRQIYQLFAFELGVMLREDTSVSSLSSFSFMFYYSRSSSNSFFM